MLKSGLIKLDFFIMQPQSDSYLTEEDVKVKFLIPFLKQAGYKETYCDFEKAIEVQEGRKTKQIFADVVVYSSAKKDTPLVLCETKAPNDILDRRVKEAAISYARLLDRIAPLALITNGSQVQVFETITKTRLPALPTKDELQKNIVGYLVNRETQDALKREARHELFIIDDVQTFKTVLKSCHTEIRNNEGYDPTIAFDEMAKVLFCKLYEEKHSQSLRFNLAVFDDTLNRLGINVIQQIFDETKKDPRYAGLFQPDEKINLQDRTIRKIIALFQDYDLSLTAFDVKGEAFEYFLGDTFTGGLGEYFTPRNVVEFIVEAINPKIGERIIDMFCGTGGFLIYAFEVVSEKIRLQDFSAEEKDRWKLELSSRSLFGTDWKERTAQACKMNMMVHGDGSAGIYKHHGLTDVAGIIEESNFDVCLTNPPFGSFENDSQILNSFELGNGRNSQSRLILGIERALKLVKRGGRIGIVVIDGILNNSSQDYVRNHIKAHAHISGVISLTSDTFEGYGSRAKTSILILEKKADTNEPPKPSFMAIANNTGYAPNGDQMAGNELPDILLAYKEYLRGTRSFPMHPNCFVVELNDRLDVEYYAEKQHPSANNDLAEAQADVAELLTKINQEHNLIEEAIKTAFENQTYVKTELAEIFQETKNRELLQPTKQYRVLGVRWWGGGTFAREEKFGREIKSKYLFRVSSGWLIYNRLFAFRGSFAIVSQDHHDCYVSGEFPTFMVKDGVANPELTSRYVVHCLNSPAYLNAIDALSTGSTKTSRNRFNQKDFLRLKVDVPQDEKGLSAIVDLLDRAVNLRFAHENLLEKTKNLHLSLSSMLPHL
jgi:type I restriction enzyme M protein